ncbi:MAG TPA: HrcA family transcriptional regulator, partial [Eubacteriales bacterium]|nr:HrcA family transcriptional regulator [Eubacteriales bacterium]
MSEKGLSQRKMRILQALVDSYVETAEPVSSAVIHDNFISDVSPATIRSELAKLEELGYIAQPHTSAGRVPLPAAYRLYVDNMLENKPLTEEEISIIEQEFAGRLQEVETLTERTARIISDITNYTSFVIVKGNEEILIKDIKLVPVDEELALVLVITDVGVMRDQFVELPKNIRGEQVYAANRVLKNIFAGKRLSEVKAT